MSEVYAIKWLDENTAARKTNEVSIVCRILDSGKSIELKGVADCEHHLVEDSAILLKKMAEVKCGMGH